MSELEDRFILPTKLSSKASIAGSGRSGEVRIKAQTFTMERGLMMPLPPPSSASSSGSSEKNVCRKKYRGSLPSTGRTWIGFGIPNGPFIVFGFSGSSISPAMAWGLKTILANAVRSCWRMAVRRRAFPRRSSQPAWRQGSQGS